MMRGGQLFGGLLNLGQLLMDPHIKYAPLPPTIEEERSHKKGISNDLAVL